MVTFLSKIFMNNSTTADWIIWKSRKEIEYENLRKCTPQIGSTTVFDQNTACR